jgi:DNA-binding transcriptional regulator GbsR (MarR family)
VEPALRAGWFESRLERSHGAGPTPIANSVKILGLVHFELNSARRLPFIGVSMTRTPFTAQEASAAERLVVPGDRAPEIVVFEKSVVDFFLSAADLLGVPKSVAAIYGVVFASPQPLSFSDVEVRLDISKGSISQGIRVLREMGALKEDSNSEDRTTRFVPDLELRKVAQRFLDTRLKPQLTAGSERLTHLKDTVPTTDEVSEATLRKRLKSLEDWQDRARTLMPLVKAVLKLS